MDEEDLNYATVTFRNYNSTPNEIKQEEPVYAEIKAKRHAPKDSTSTNTHNGAPAPHTVRFCVLSVCLGVLCVLLLSAIITLIYFVASVHDTHYSNLTSQNLKLRTDMVHLERQKEDLTRERDGLNWTIEVILQFDNFPVNDYCPQKECKPCLDGWLLFKSSCYQISLSPSWNWESWHSSRQQCQEKTADLVVIGSPEEQEFISNHTKFYYDEFHGYWIGLTEHTGSWHWVDGSNLTAGYWMAQQLGSSGSCTLTLPDMDPWASWDKAKCTRFYNRWICEAKALIKSD